MTTLLDQSYKLVIENKDSEIDRLIGERNKLEKKIEEYEMRENVMKVFLIIQAGILAVAFQIWD